MKESDVYSPIIAGMLNDRCLVFKIADGSAGKKPFDVVGIGRLTGKGIGLEIKATNLKPEAIGVDWSLFQSHQITWLRAYAESDATSLAAIYDKTSRQLLVWRIEHANDRCDRPADLTLSRNDKGIFTGWRIILDKQKKLDTDKLKPS